LKQRRGIAHLVCNYSNFARDGNELMGILISVSIDGHTQEAIGEGLVKVTREAVTSGIFLTL
jgi:hypothetical protein